MRSQEFVQFLPLFRGDWDGSHPTSVAQSNSFFKCQRNLAVAKAIGATRAGALKTTFAEETELDLFEERTVWPAISGLLTLAYKGLTEQGYQPEIGALDDIRDDAFAREWEAERQAGYPVFDRVKSETLAHEIIQRLV